ncbi:alkyl hydroperoxide reductase/ Thiol specific antioxidant/ Mal allergen [Sulfurihydrogenibium sp. YO3AOP1]|jgi:peroxiredoxin Q/BCP|uniref:redoxin domain-containing protein n=1 Tax=Sulfurihydrogenibium sp. (strain YO3AOP1) TaxID=436114 RepID=UPI00017267DD|nr:peroxiredoxin [Sulfurihydrogenibium sp. YO3AOP1]ACD66849.1 alkyl hydroperoxide reductase/ Thiol specific antioxidant/ Mal allergen [Sulfurihydrogenibium sp. YO3AOP1]
MEKAIDFCLPGIDEKGNEINFCLKDYLGKDKDVILYFYPKDDTPGCTTEACDFRDNLNILQNYAIVVGVSPDSIESHKKFKEKYGLNFILLSDKNKEVMKQYGAYGKKVMYGKETEGVIRSTFIISPDGSIKKAWKNVKAKGHVEQILKFLGVKS